MKKYIISLLSILAIIIPINVYAASGKITVSGNTSLNLNSTITVTVKVSATGGKPGSWSFGVQYDKSKLEYVSGSPLTIVDANSTGTKTSETYTYKFKAIATGKASISIEDAYMLDYDTEKKVTVTTGSLSINISKPVVVNHSSDNNLSSLVVEGADLNPAFDKSVLEYSANLSFWADKIKIIAAANDNKATVSGTGEISIIEGTNKVEVVVTAENGAKKTYVINLSVPEKEPIQTNFRGETYSLMRKLPEETPYGFSVQVLNVGEEVIEALYNEVLKITLVYAMDENGNASFYQYKNDQIIDDFLLITSKDTAIILVNTDRDIKGMTDTNLVINGQNIKVLRIKNNEQFYIVKGINLLTGETDYYNYDHENGTLSIFDEEGYLYLFNNITDFTPIVYGLTGAVIVQVLIIILISNNKNKLKKALKQKMTEKKELPSKETEKIKKPKKEKDFFEE